MAASGDPRAKKQARKLAFGSSKRGGKGLETRPGNMPSLERDQCAYCKKLGDRKNGCPELEGSKAEPLDPLELGEMSD